MKRVSFALTLTALLLSFGLANSLVITGSFEGAGIYDGGTKINVNVDFDVVITANNDDVLRLGWSSPFSFSGTGNVTTLNSESFTRNATFDAIWDMGIFEAQESWDLNLTTPDQYNYSGISMAGWLPGGGALEAFRFTFNIAGDATTAGDFCVAQGDFTNNTYDWLFEDPVPSFTTVCLPVVLQPNVPPVFTNCPGSDIIGQWDDPFYVDLNATDGESDPITFEMVSGPGTVDPVTGEWSFNATCDDVGSHTVVVCASDPFNPCPTGQECTFNVSVLNTAPVIAGDCGDTITVGTGNFGTANFTATDANTGDTQDWSVSGVTPTPVGTYGVVNGELTFYPDAADADICFTFTVRVTDCADDFDECDVTFCVVSELPFDIVIEKVHDVYQGHHVLVGVHKTAGSEEMWGFDFLIGYDVSALAFTGAIPGIIFDMPGDYEWEYFTYRYNWNGNCGNACPTGLLRVVGMADQNDGAHHPPIPDGVMIPDCTWLFYLDFLVTNDRNYQCMFVPIYWYWMDCGDNAIAFRYRSDIPELMIRTALAKEVYHYCCDEEADPPHYCEITDTAYGFPGWFGPHYSCFDCMDPQNPLKCPVPFIRLFGGGVDIICVNDIDDRGDVNLNGIMNEIADAVVFTNYFIYGLSAFTINVEGQIAATEINGDGVPLTVGDLVYLIRVIVGDAMPLPPMKVAPVIESNVIAGRTVTMDAEIGAALFVFEGKADVSLAEGALGMDLKADYVDGVTRALVYSFSEGTVASGAILNTNGNLISVEAADYNGNAITTTIVPAEFSLSNYPNPFNPTTTVEMSLPVASDWTLSIYNVVGQRVAEYSGYNEAGRVLVEFDGSGLASGVYFYKVEAGQFSATKKMLLLK